MGWVAAAQKGGVALRQVAKGAIKANFGVGIVPSPCLALSLIRDLPN